MDDNRRYEAFVRNRITELREQKGVSEHRMSLELGKSGSYIRSITNGISMPSLRELFNIMEYFDLTPTLFFAPMDDPDSLRGIIALLIASRRKGIRQSTQRNAHSSTEAASTFSTALHIPASAAGRFSTAVLSLS